MPLGPVEWPISSGQNRFSAFDRAMSGFVRCRRSPRAHARLPRSTRLRHDLAGLMCSSIDGTDISAVIASAASRFCIERSLKS